MLSQPSIILVHFRSIDDEHEPLLLQAVEDEIINDATMLIQHQRVVTLARLQISDAIRQLPIQPSTRLCAFDENLSHVGNIKHPAGTARGLMLGDNARILNGHPPTGEANHPGTQGFVFRLERRFEQAVLSHWTERTSPSIVCQRHFPGQLTYYGCTSERSALYRPTMEVYFRMEQKFEHWGIPRLVRILAIFKLVTWVLLMGNPSFLEVLLFDLGKIYQGEVWRLASFLILPNSGDSLLIIIEIFFLFMIGDCLEQAWGPFGVTLYIFGSALMGIAVCVLLSFTVKYPILTNMAIYASLVMAAGCLYPDIIIQLFLIIPVKLKYIGMIAGFGVLLRVFGSANNLTTFIGIGLPILACLIPFALVFVPRLMKGLQRQSKATTRRSRFERSKLPENEAFHKCDQCGATEVSHADREFRITDAGQEWCSECRDTSVVD